MMFPLISVVELGVVAVALMCVFVALRGLERQRDQWRGVAGELAESVRVDAWPLMPTTDAPAAEMRSVLPSGRSSIAGVAVVAIPARVAVMGREEELAVWSKRASAALHRYDQLVEPEERW